jgi:WD40 repeat protein
MLLDPAGRRPLRELVRLGERVFGLAVSPDGADLIAACGDGSSAIIPLADAKNTRTLPGHAGLALQVAILPPGDRFATVGEDGDLRVWDRKTGNLRYAGRAHSAWAFSVAAVRGSELLATAGEEGWARIWSLARPQRQTLEHTSSVHGIAFSPDGRWLATCTDGRRVRMSDAATGTERWSSLEHAAILTRVRFSPDGSRLASAGLDGRILIFEASSGRVLHRLEGHQAPVFSLAWAVDGAWLASAAQDGTVQVWEPGKTEAPRSLSHALERVWGVASSGDGRWLLVCGKDGAAIYDPRTFAPLAHIGQTAGEIFSATFSADSRHLVTCGWDGHLSLWESASWRLVRRWRAHERMINNASFSPDGRLLATSSDDPFVGVWDARSGEALLRFDTVGGVNQVEFSPHNLVLAMTEGQSVWSTPIDLTGLGDDPQAELTRTQRQAGLRLDGFLLHPDPETSPDPQSAQ